MEVAQEVSTFLLMCGGAGIGKSMRAQRLKRLLVKGWLMSSGGGSEQAGKNGGMEDTCGRCLYYDEIMKEYAADNSPRLEHLKQISWDQQAQHNRTIQVKLSNGSEMYKTSLINTIHYETHWISTNCGPCGIKGDQEPSDDRTPLIDRSISHCVRAVKSKAVAFSESDFESALSDKKMRAHLTRFRIMSGLTCMILMFIKHLPFCQPDCAFALTLFSAFDDMLWNEYNIPRPSPRKQTKRRMVLMVLTIEAALADKFFLKESAIAYKDMHPDENGFLRPFDMEQLVDVIRSLQQSMSPEVIVNAWSHALDYSPFTSAHVFHVKTLLSQIHGSELDMKTFPVPEDDPGAPPPPPPSQPPPPPPPPQPPPPPPREVAILCANNGLSDQFPPDKAQRDGDEDDDVSMATEPPPEIDLGGFEELDSTAEEMHAADQESDRSEVAHDVHDRPVTTSKHALPVGIMDSNVVLTRRSIGELSQRMAKQRLYRNRVSKRLLEQPDLAGRGKKPIEIFKTILGKDERAAYCCIPSTQDVLNAGYSDEFLSDMLHLERMGKTAEEWDTKQWASKEFGKGEERLGTSSRCLGWEYNTRKGTGPAEYDFCWAFLCRFNKIKKAVEAQESIKGDQASWNQAARIVRSAGKSTLMKNAFSATDVLGMTLNALRDTMFLISYKAQDNECRIPVSKSTGYDQGGETTVGMRCFQDKDGVLVETPAMSSSDESKRPQKIFPSGVTFEDLRKSVDVPRLSDEFCPTEKYRDGAFKGKPKSKSATVLRNRLDTMVQAPNALPACYTATQYESGQPLKFDGGVMLWNKGIGTAHAALVVEMSAYLTGKPGIFGGYFGQVPSTFRRFKDRVARQDPAKDKPPHEEDREEGDEEGEEEDAADSEPEYSEFTPMEVVQDDDDDDMIPAHDKPLGDGAADIARNGPSKHPGNEALAQVADPSAAADPLLRACPGASLRAERIAAGPDAMVTQLGYTWDMSAMFFTYKAIGMLHNDRHKYVVAMRDKYPDVFKGEQTKIQTMEALPHIVMRFPGIAPDAESAESYPLSDPMPLKVSRVQQADSHKELTKSNPQLTTDFISMFIGRSVDADDPEVEAYQASKFGRQAISGVKGNVFAHETWSRFTFLALRRRGMYRTDDADRVRDHGMFLLNRIRAHNGRQRCIEKVLFEEEQRRQKPDTDARRAALEKLLALRAEHRRKLEEEEIALDELGDEPDFSDEVDLMDVSEDGMRTLYEKFGLDFDHEQQRMQDGDGEDPGPAFVMETDEDDSDRHLHLWNPHLEREKRTKGRTWAAQEKRQREGEPPELDAMHDVALAARVKRVGTERKRKDEFDTWRLDQDGKVTARKKQSTSRQSSHASSPQAAGSSMDGEAGGSA